MRKPVIITSDSTCDLTPELLERFQIHVIPLTILLGEESFPDGAEFTAADLYRRFRHDGTLPKTSAPSVSQYEEFFSELLAGGDEIVHLTISSELSSSCQNAHVAAAELGGVYVVDSRMLSNGVGLLAIEAAECRDRGMAAEEIAACLRELTGRVDTSFVLNALDFMRKSGRCSGVAAIGANLLHIKPALAMKDGKLQIYKKYRGHSMTEVYRQYIIERLEGKRPRRDHVFLIDSGEVDEAVLRELEQLVLSLTGAKELHRAVAGCTISSHCGPATVGLMFLDEA